MWDDLQAHLLGIPHSDPDVQHGAKKANAKAKKAKGGGARSGRGRKREAEEAVGHSALERRLTWRVLGGQDGERGRDRKHAMQVLVLGNGSAAHIAAFGLTVPAELRAYVHVRTGLRFAPYYETIQRAHALLTQFGSDAYVTYKISSTVITSLITGTPMILPRAALRVYAFLSEEAVYVQVCVWWWWWCGVVGGGGTGEGGVWTHLWQCTHGQGAFPASRYMPAHSCAQARKRRRVMRQAWPRTGRALPVTGHQHHHCVCVFAARACAPAGARARA